MQYKPLLRMRFEGTTSKHWSNFYDLAALWARQKCLHIGSSQNQLKLCFEQLFLGLFFQRTTVVKEAHIPPPE